MTQLKEALQAPTPVCAPLVLNPLMAKLAEAAGFPALYLGGGASGYANTALEANLTVTEMVRVGVEIRAVTSLPLILDAAAGFGDPMHVNHTIAMAEAAGFAAIEIEDQHLPKRAHHHIGIEHMVPREIMEAKVRVAVAARRDPAFLIIARSNGVRASDMDDALRRAEAYRKAGADVLLLSPRNAEEARHIGERLGAPLMYICKPGGLASIGLTPEEMHGMGYSIIVDTLTPLLALFDTMKGIYVELAGDFAITSRTPEGWERLQEELHGVIDLEKLLTIERETVEKESVEKDSVEQ